MDKFILDTRKSLYAPIEVKIDEKIYQTIKITHAVKAEMRKLELEIPKGNDKALYEWISFMFNLEKAILEKLDVREVEDIYLYTVKKLRDSEAERMKREFNVMEKQVEQLGIKKQEPKPKNLKRPGEKK